MKVYVHLEHRAPEFTLLYQPDNQAKVSDLIEAFVRAYTTKFGDQHALDSNQISITNERRKTLIPSSVVDKVAKDKEDLYVNIASTSSSSKSAPSSSATQPTQISVTPETSPPEVNTAVPSITPTTPLPSSPIPNQPETSTTTSSSLLESNQQPSAKPAAKQPNFPTTTRVTTSDQPVSIPIPEKVSSELTSMVSQLRDSQISGSSGKPLRLEQYPTGVQEWVKQSIQMGDRIAQQGNFKQAIAIHDQILTIVPLHAQSLLRMGELYFAAGRFNLAIEYFQKGVESSPDILFEMGVADSNFQKGEYMEAAKYYMRALRLVENSPNAELKTRVQVLIAKALYKSGGHQERETALQIVMTVLKANEEHVEALHVYGFAMKDMGKISDAMRVFLKILVLSPNDKTVKEDLADLLQMAGGLVSLFTELAPNPSSAPAYGFIATFIKEFGAVAESVALYKKALDIKPSSSSYCLNLVHTMEVQGTYREALEVIQKFCRDNPSLSVYDAIKGVGDLYEHTKKLWITPEEAAGIQPSKFDLEPQKPIVPNPSLKPYDSDELDLLALFATIPKICYAVGALDIIPAIVRLVEPQREGRELHTTPIRNEMAYYSCVVQLLLTQTRPLVNHRKIYVAGDSHSLSPGWRTITVKGETILLQPALVTGLKIWHLRPNTKFFPKANFKNVIKKIPKGSSVIMTFGEIDCREGLLVSVEKCRYDDLDEAIRVTLDIYVTVLRQLISENKFTIYIHPPPPVLDPTRKQVKRFAKALKERIAKEPGIHFLDIFESMLSPDKDDLHAPYKFDGTHLDPCYISLIEDALNNLPN